MTGITNIEYGKTVPIALQFEDGATNQYPRAEVRDADNNLLTTLDLSHVASGMYNISSPYIMPDVVHIVVTYIVYSDAAHTIVSGIYYRDVDVFVRTKVKSVVDEISTSLHTHDQNIKAIMLWW